MKKLLKENLLQFLEYYHYLHDSYITNIHYDIYNSKIEMLTNIVWSGTPILKKDNTYQTNNVKMKIVFNDIEKCTIKEFLPWDYINEVNIDYVIIDNKEYICFKTVEVEPLVNIVCSSIEYKEFKEENNQNE